MATKVERILRIKRELDSLARPLRDPEALREIVEHLLRVMYLEALEELDDREIY